MYSFDIIEHHYTAPNGISPFYDDGIKIPRKLKKRVKSFCGCHWNCLTNGQRLWEYMDKYNPSYKIFLIKQICKYEYR